MAKAKPKSKKAAVRPPKKGAAKASQKSASKPAKADKSTIKLAQPKDIVGQSSIDARLTRFEKDASGVRGDISALKAEAEKKHVMWPAFKDARDIAKMTDQKIGVYMAHLLHYLEVFDIPERARMSLGLVAENVLKDAQKAAGEAAKLREKAESDTKAAAKSTGQRRDATKTVAQQVADRAEERSKQTQEQLLTQVGRGDANAGPATNGHSHGDGETSLDEIRRKIEAKEFVSPAERQKLADFDTEGVTAQ
jgi:ElaB/YqjD/DUF883 family membrane-anchored ribosome-binding protein